MKKRLVIVVLAFCLVLSLLACGKKTGDDSNAAQTQAQMSWQEQYDLGIRLLNEGKYEDAILAFQAAISIDPKRADAYVSLADVYMANGQMGKAQEVLNDALQNVEDAASIQDKMEEIQRESVGVIEEVSSTGVESETLQEMLGEITYPRLLKEEWTKDVLEDGSFLKYGWERYEYDDNGRLKVSYDMNADTGEISWQYKYVYNSEEVCLGFVLYDGDGSERFTSRYYYDSKGRLIPTGFMCWQETDDQGRCVRLTSATSSNDQIVGTFGYDADGNYSHMYEWYEGSTPTVRNFYFYDDQGRLVREESYGRTDDDYRGLTLYEYNAEGALVKEVVENYIMAKVFVTVYTYENGQLMQTITTETSEGEVLDSKELYEYNEHGELTKILRYRASEETGELELTSYKEYFYE